EHPSAGHDLAAGPAGRRPGATTAGHRTGAEQPLPATRRTPGTAAVRPVAGSRNRCQAAPAVARAASTGTCMHVLILGARAPACLEWARACAASGHQVTVADSLA